MRKHVSILCSATLLGAVAVSADAQALTASDIFVGTTPARGVRPLLTILVDFSDAKFPSGFNTSYYRQLLFGSDGVIPLVPNVAGIGGYFHYTSQWSFRFSNAGVVGPFTALNDPATTGDDSYWSCLVGGDTSNGTCPAGPSSDPSAFTHIKNALVAAANQVRMRDFDTNADGTVTSNELAVLIIEAVPNDTHYGGGAHRGSNPRIINLSGGLTPGVNLNLSAALVRQSGDVETMIHELTHNIGIGTPEPYGAYSSNLNVGMMSAVDKVAHGRSTVLYDPYIRMKLGWIQPSFVGSSDSGTFSLMAANNAYGQQDRALVIHDAAHGNREFFVLEYRTKTNRRTLTPGMIELHQLWSADETNHMLTTDPKYDGVPGSKFTIYGKSYEYLRPEGWVMPQSGASSTTVALYSWRSPSRLDDFATGTFTPSSPPAPAPDYQNAIFVGHAIKPNLAVAGNMQLYRWWNPVTLDQITSSDHDWSSIYAGKKGDYQYVMVEGQVSWAPDLNYDADPWNVGYSRLPNEGLAIWHVRLDPTNQYFQAFPSQPVPPADVPLTRWWSAQREDNFETSTWPAQKTIPSLDYVYGGEIGRLYAAPGTGRKKMWLWYSETRGDNFSTTNPAWEGTMPGQIREGYRYVGLEGYVTETAIGDSKVPLYSYWNAQRGDNMISTETSVSGYTQVRLEGYIRPAVVDAGLYIVPPGGAPEGHPAQKALWTNADGTATLKWFDGSTACTVRVVSTTVGLQRLSVRMN